MQLPINEDYRAVTDPHCWILQKRKPNKKKGTETWVGYQYYGTLQSLINGLSDQMLLDSEAETLADALAEAKRITSVLTSALTPRFEVNEVVDNATV